MQNKIIIITGGGAGIGAAAAKLFAKNGATVIIAEINKQNAEATRDEITKAGGKAEIAIANVTDFQAVKYLIADTVEKHGRIDVMVNNAGIGNKQLLRTAEHTLEDWENVIAVNQTGVFYCMKLALQQMMIQGEGNIVNVASLAGLKASGSNIAYTASKFAVVGMTKSAALEYASKNIRINAVCPGYTRTALFEGITQNNEELEKKLLKYIPMKRYGQTEEIADAIYWLASSKTSYITGQTITLDGGTSL